MDRISKVLDMKNSMEFGTAQRQNCSSLLSFRNVDFQYAGASRPSLTGISFDLKKGETLGIIGSTGSGKSTLVSLIPRLYDVSAGEIRLNGTEIQKYSKEELQSMVAVVPQKAMLFAGTVRSNLLWGNPAAGEEELWHALEAAQAAEFVRQMPEGLNASVAQNGRNLSGGQKQRLTIARAILKKAEILILDDSASALDYATDAALRKAVAALPGTVITVSQRISSVKHADKILVLDDGRLAGQGTHEKLLEACTVYREIYESQNRKEGQQ